MGAKERFKNHFRFSLDYWSLKHDNASDFYLSCWQTNRAALPLLCVRLAFLFVAVGTMAYSLIASVSQSRDLTYWAIYFTQWGVMINVILTTLAVAVSAVAYFRGPIDSTFKLPWYIRLYWVVYCIALPVSFHVTIFYYSFLTDAYPEDFEVNRLLDALVHAVNSVLTFCVMATSRQPLYFVQLIFPFALLVVYMTFSIIYYYAGGTNQLGQHFIYPMLDWANPGPTVGVVFLCTALISATTLIAVLFTILRDYLSNKITSNSTYALS